jgi:signal transduction histidine kinase
VPPEALELRSLRQLAALRSQFREGHDVAKVTRATLRAAMELLCAPEGCVALLAPGQQQVEIAFSIPPKISWEGALLTSFIRGGEDPIPADLALGRLRRRRRMWGVVVVRRPGGRLTWDHRAALSALAAATNDILERVDQERIREVRARIDYKILEQLRPKDLFYQVLHGLHSLTQYDHSAALLIYDAGALEVVAETITWRKAKSDKIGLKLPLPDALLPSLLHGDVYGFDRPGEAWEGWTHSASTRLAELVDTYAVEAERGTVPRDRSVLCAPLTTRDGVLGLLKVAAKHSGFFGAYEADLIAQFLPYASIALQNSQRTATLERNLIQAERKHAMAELARGVAHDVNNALGAVLPLVQQLRAELTSGAVELVALAEDLGQIERSIQISRRIFGGMLTFARGAVHETGGADIQHAVDNTLGILRDGLERRGVQLAVAVAPGLPALPAAQGDVEQLLLNLVSNARDAMPHGGRLRIAAGLDERTVRLVVEDSGSGIAPEDLPRVLEPFFSTKPQGNGLGLSICRSIVWQMEGKLDISSAPGQGTSVTVTIPVPAAEAP